MPKDKVDSKTTSGRASFDAAFGREMGYGQCRFYRRIARIERIRRGHERCGYDWEARSFHPHTHDNHRRRRRSHLSQGSLEASRTSVENRFRPRTAIRFEVHDRAITT